MKKSPIFIGGAGRSGTTLLRIILDSHPHIACGPEFKATPLILDLWAELQTNLASSMREYFIEEEDINWLFSEVITNLLSPYLSKKQKSRIAEKTPNNVFFFQHLHHVFPDSPLIHVIRDGRDVVSSLLSMNWMDGEGNRLGITQSAQQAANYWVQAVEAGQQAGKNIGTASCYMEVQYEDLILNPEDTLKKVFQFIDEPWDTRVLDFHKISHDLAGESSETQVKQRIYSTSIGRWRNDLSASDQIIVKQITEPLLSKLGYCN